MHCYMYDFTDSVLLFNNNCIILGATLTAGAGCWIKIDKCPKHTRQNLYFYDGWAEANMHTGIQLFVATVA